MWRRPSTPSPSSFQCDLPGCGRRSEKRRRIPRRCRAGQAAGELDNHAKPCLGITLDRERQAAGILGERSARPWVRIPPRVCGNPARKRSLQELAPSNPPQWFHVHSTTASGMVCPVRFFDTEYRDLTPYPVSLPRGNPGESLFNNSQPGAATASPPRRLQSACPRRRNRRTSGFRGE